MLFIADLSYRLFFGVEEGDKINEGFRFYGVAGRMFYSVFAGYYTGIKFLCEMFDALCCRISSTEQDVKNSRHNLFVVFASFSLAFFFNSHLSPSKETNHPL